MALHLVQLVTYLESTVQVAQPEGQAKHNVYILLIPDVFPQAAVTVAVAALHVPPSQVSLTEHPVQFGAQALHTLAVESNKYPALHESHPPAAEQVKQLAPQAEQAPEARKNADAQVVQTVADEQTSQLAGQASQDV